MKKTFKPLILCLIILCVPILISADVEKIDVSNGDFETILGNKMPASWKIQQPFPDSESRVLPVSEGAFSGRNCLMISHKKMAETVVLSDAVHLKVGRLYKISGYIKTEDAFTDPTDRYPTSVAACLRMESLPFTNHSPSVGASTSWEPVELIFVASRSIDRVQLCAGHNGKMRGKVWFDQIQLAPVTSITEHIPMETVTWFGPAYRYSDKGWIFVHIEGKPYQRGYQYGYLLADEITSYIRKLAYQKNNNKPVNGWRDYRFITDTMMLRKYEVEYLEEMKGIADGAAKNGGTLFNRPVDFIDIVTLNSVIDIGQMGSALRRTGHPLSGRSFLSAEEELLIPIREHKCSGFVANGPATTDGGIVFGQIFMWGGYTGIHWNVICDVDPEKGHRLVYETFPGGIHSGADFYVNESGIMIGETTTSQTPYDVDGTPQSNRIRKAAQYASSIDDVVRILKYKNNGMYTNDWLIGDTKTNEIAIFLLGTKKNKLWRSRSGFFPGGTKGFFWSNNNNKDPEVRKEYIPNADNSPYDLIFTPWNRDIAFYEWFQKFKGKIDSIAGVNLWASSPINRAHACDGKIITSEMAKELVFFAHYGKVTLREKMVGGRFIRDYPEAVPHLSLGYSIASPKRITDELKAVKKNHQFRKHAKKGQKVDVSAAEDLYHYQKQDLWFNTVYPASSKVNWFISGTAYYWRMMNTLATGKRDKISYMDDQMAYLNSRLLYIQSREGTLAPIDAKRVYHQYKHYQIPRIKGTYLLHQLRLYLGNKTFSKIMNRLHNQNMNKSLSLEKLIKTSESVSGKKLKGFIDQWIRRSDLPEIKISADSVKTDDTWRVELTVDQTGKPYHFFTTVDIGTAKGVKRHLVEVSTSRTSLSFVSESQPISLSFNAGNDVPVNMERFYSFSNFYDDFHHTLIIHGTSRQIEANRTLAFGFQEVLADRYSEILCPVKKESEVTGKDLRENDLMVLGGTADNTLTKKLAEQLGLKLGKNHFTWMGKTYGDSDDGLIAVFPNPYNKQKAVYLIIGNSALQLYQMTRRYHRISSWAVFKNDKVKEQGYFSRKSFHICFESMEK